MRQTVDEINTEEVLKLRAQSLARVPGAKRAADADIPVVLFQLAGENYAIETTYATEVFPLEHLAPVPCTPPFVLGVVMVHSRVVSVIDLRRFFGLPIKGITNLNRVIVLADGRMEFGILADRIMAATTISREALSAPPGSLSDAGREYVAGVAPAGKDGKPIVFLDARKLLTSTRVVVKEMVGSRQGSA